LEQFEMMKILQNSIESVRIGQREEDIGKIERVNSLLVVIEDAIRMDFDNKMHDIQVPNGNLIMFEFILKKYMMAVMGMNECNGNILLKLGQVSFIEKFQNEVKDMKYEYGDNRISGKSQLSEMGERFNQLVSKKIRNLSRTIQKFHNQWILAIRNKVNCAFGHVGNELRNMKYEVERGKDRPRLWKS
jgi:hypothetical protein